jgi:hypothetical protein
MTKKSVTDGRTDGQTDRRTDDSTKLHSFQKCALKIVLPTYLLIKKLSLSRLLTDLAHFNGPELPVNQFSIAKKNIFIKTINIKGLLFQHFYFSF